MTHWFQDSQASQSILNGFDNTMTHWFQDFFINYTCISCFSLQTTSNTYYFDHSKILSLKMNSNFINPPHSSSSSSSSDDDDNMQMINSLEEEEEEAICRAIANNNLIIQYLLNQQNNQVIHGGSVPGRSVINRDRESADCRLFNDYFSETPLYNDVMFRRRYRMSRSLFLRIINTVKGHDVYFTQ